jgi:beta-N-acetylhexosaminidase
MLRPLAFALVILTSLSTNAEKEKFNQPAPVKASHDATRWAQKTLKKLSPEEKVGQIIMVRALGVFANAEDPRYLELRDQIKKFHIGSVIMTVSVDGGILVRGGPYDTAMMANQLQRDSDLPLIIAADYERGPSMRMAGTPWFPAAMAFGATYDPKLEEKFGQIVAEESRAMGVQWNLYPVADVNSNPANPIINTRSYGEEPKMVGEFAAAYVRGSKAGGMLSTAKHFPGHGDTATDSHLELAKVSGDLQRLHAVELPPFQAAFDAGVDAVMIAHVTVPALEPDPNKVATISHNVVTDLLRGEMHFSGIAVTDALDMNALTAVYGGDRKQAAGKAAVDAFLAGNDLILMPSDLEGAYDGLLAAVKSGAISKERLDASVLKILQAKAEVGLNRGRSVDLERVRHIVGRPEDVQFAQQVADASVTLVRDNGKVWPVLEAARRTAMQQQQGTSAPRQTYGNVAPTGTAVVALVLVDNARSESGREFTRQLRARLPDARVIWIEPRVVDAIAQQVAEAVEKAGAVIIAAFEVPSAGKAGQNGSTGALQLQGGTAAIVQKTLDAAGEKTIMVAMGSPYVAMDFPAIQNYVCAYSNVPTSETAAVKAMFGEIDFRGRLPVTLPGIAPAGTGIVRTAAAPAQTQ